MPILTKEIKNSIPYRYAVSVQNGKIVTGKKIKLAIERFFEWVKNAEKGDGFYLDHQKGMLIINFFEKFLVHTKGKKVGQAFVLSPFQQFTLWNVFGWQQKTEYGSKRRINNVYEKVAKKNGKTAVMAGVGLYCMSFDLEAGAEIYIGATKEEQAKLCFQQAVEFIQKSAALRQIGFECLQKNIRFRRNNASLKPLGGDSKTQDGINCHLAIIDEYHAHKDDSVKENLESSMASRVQPIVYTITTAGVNLSGVCKKFEETCESILNKQLEDDHFFVMIHDLDDGDDWEVIENWQKANPNLGVSVDKSFLIKEYNKAKNQPSKIPNFKTKHLNMWVDAPEIWIPSEVWKRNIVKTKNYEKLFLEKAQKFGTYAGLDLSTNIDITAYVLLTNPDENGNQYIKPYFFCPQNTIEIRSKEDRVPYRYWATKEFLNATPGERVDYNEIKKTILSTYLKYNIQNIEIDKWNATQLVTELMENDVPVAYFSQSIGVISYPTKQFEILVYDGKIVHDGNPMLEWMLSGCVIDVDTNENIKVHKGRSHSGQKRVDGIIATIMALGGYLSVDSDESEESIYNNPETEISFGV